MNNQANNDKTIDQTNLRATYEDMQKMLSLHIWKNNHLREEILNNPTQTIERDLKVKFDDHLKINVVNHIDPNEVTFILPYDIKKDNAELSDDQLEEASGGFIFGALMGGIAQMAGATPEQLDKINKAGQLADGLTNAGLSLFGPKIGL